MCRSRHLFTSVALFALLPLLGLSGSTGRRAPVSKPQRQARYAPLPLSFELNQGQADGQVQFLSRGPGYSLFLTGTEAVLSLKQPGSGRTASRKPQARDGERPHPHTPTPPHSHTLRMRLAGANPKPEVRGLERLPGVSHYFLGSDPNQWRTNVPHYAKVRYEEVYPGIDLVYYGNQQQLEYDFVVAPGADPDQVRLAFEGAERVDLDGAGDLLLHTAGGTVRQHKPVVYQEDDGARQTVEGEYRLLADGRVGFEVGAYDPGKPLVIDPVLTYSTYLGGSSWDEVTGVAVDSSGAVYVTGETQSQDFPVANALQPGNGGDRYPRDAFVTKINPAGTALVYSTYFGGDGDEFPAKIAVDGAGSAYLCGNTYGSSFPTTPGAFDTTPNGEDDGYVAKLNATGDVLVYSTFLGGSSFDSLYDIAVDSSGAAYVTGSTYSVDFPVTPGAFQSSPPSPGNVDAFVTRIGATGSSLLYSTYLGGGHIDVGRAIAVDDSGGAYVTGHTYSADFPVTPGSFDTTFAENNSDVFVAKLNPTGTELIYATFVGASARDVGTAISVDAGGNAGVTGWVEYNIYGTREFPTTPGALDSTPDGDTDAFVCKLNPAGTALVYSTLLGGRSHDGGQGIALRPAGEAYVSGRTDSSDFPVREPLQPDLAGGDAFVTGLAPDGSALTFSTFLSDAEGADIALDPSAAIYLAGATYGGFPTANPLFPFRGGSRDGFVAKIRLTTFPPPTGLSAAAVSDSEIRLDWRDNTTLEAGYRVERGRVLQFGIGPFEEVAILGPDVSSYTDRSLAHGATYRYRVRAFGAAGFSGYTNMARATTPALSAPAGLSAEPLSHSQVRLTWQDNSSTEAGFHIERRTSTSGFTRVATVAADAVTFEDAGLAEDRAYFYRVQAYNPSNLSAYSNEATAVTLLNPPAALSATVLSGRQARLTWSDGSARESGYQVERKTGTGAFTRVSTTGVNVTAFTDTGLTPLTGYTYRVRAVSATNTSVYSNEVTVTTLADVPEPPSSVALTVSTGIIQVRWSDNSSNETGFKVERRTGSGSYSEVAVLPAGSIAFTDRGLTGGGTYTYRVRAYNSHGNSLYSNEATAVLAGPPPPSSVTAAVLWSTRIRVTWQDNSAGEYGFRVERRTGAGSFVEVRVVSSNVTLLLDTGLTPGTWYTYRVRAYNGIGTSAYSNEATATTPALPAAPSNLTASAVSGTRIWVRWRDNATDEVDYRISRRAGDGPWVEFRALPANSISFVDQGLTSGTPYTYRVRAYGPGGMSGYSNEAMATTHP